MKPSELCSAPKCTSDSVGENIHYTPHDGKQYRQPLCAEHGGLDAAWKYGEIYTVNLPVLTGGAK